MPTLVETRAAVLVKAIQEYEATRANPSTVTPSMIASGLAGKYPCTGLTAGEILAHLDLYLGARQTYYEVYPDGTAEELLAVWAQAAGAYSEALYQACDAGLSTSGIRMGDHMQDVVEAYRE